MSETVYVVHDYLRRIDKEMTCDKKKKKQFLQRLQNDMEDFADSATTTLTENDLEKHFGTPQSHGRKLSVGRAMLGASSISRWTGTGSLPLYFRSATKYRVWMSCP